MATASSSARKADRAEPALPRRTRAERYAAGKALRERCPRRSHATWKARPGRPDPVELVLRSEKGRLPDLQKEKAKSIAEHVFPKLVEHADGLPVIKDQLPTIFHAKGFAPGEIEKTLREALAAYRATLPQSYQSLLDRYELRDAAIKVVGIGSVGTACWVFLFTAGDDDPLFLQVKEARPSVLEPYAGASAFENHGQRVVNGYRLMQPASDIFLGWTRTARRHYYLRQLRDVKIAARVETFGSAEMELYTRWCGRALALSHARAGVADLLSGYMGRSDAFDEAIAAFSMDYADQNERDHAALARAVRRGRVKAAVEAAR